MRASTAHIQMQRKPPGYRQDILPSKETSLKASRTLTTLKAPPLQIKHDLVIDRVCRLLSLYDARLASIAG